jgi:antitoxin (DNA-binding transcriptional repressor) of toxin-antitoxin stability system
MEETIVTAVEARRRLGDLLLRVSMLGEEIVIEKAGNKIAKLVGYEAASPQEEMTVQYHGQNDFRESAGLMKNIGNGNDNMTNNNYPQVDACNNVTFNSNQGNS